MVDKTMMQVLRDSFREFYEVACGKGWWGSPEDRQVELSADSVLAKLMLVVSELSEATELVREKDFDPRLTFYVGGADLVSESLGQKIPYDEWRRHRGYYAVFDLEGKEAADRLQPKPEGLGVELADAVIRIGDLTERMGVDLAAAIVLKNEFNKSRPQRHGGKRA